MEMVLQLRTGSSERASECRGTLKRSFNLFVKKRGLQYLFSCRRRNDRQMEHHTHCQGCSESLHEQPARLRHKESGMVQCGVRGFVRRLCCLAGGLPAAGIHACL